MSIEKLINALFKLSGGQAMPKYESAITYNGEGTYIAPYNGYIHLHGVAEDAEDELYVDINEDRKTNLLATTKGNWLDFILPVRKGDRCEASIIGVTSTVSVKFYQTMGGG